MSRRICPDPLNRRVARLLVLAFLIVLAGVSVAWARDPQTQGQGVTVLGEVVNGTADSPVPDDLSITLHAFSGMEETNVFTTTVEEGGGFRFEDISLDEGETLVARALYEGVTYVSDFVTVEQGEEELTLPVTIYETTEESVAISVAQLHLFVNKTGELVQVGAYAVLGNTGSRTYVGTPAEGRSITWSAELPDGAQNLRFDNGELGGRFVSTGGGFADTRPIPPGSASVETSFTYELPFREGIEIEQSFDVPVRAAVLVLPEGGWDLTGATLVSEGTLDTQMGPALSYTAGPFDANEPLAFAMVPEAAMGLGASESADRRSPTEVALGITALIVAGVMITLMWWSPAEGPIPAKARAQVEAIAALDREFENGTLPEKTYRKERRSLKRRLHQMLSD